MNQKCLTTIFVPVQQMNVNNSPLSVCQEHKKPLSYYNKCKPDNEPICLDCLLQEIKEGKDSNLFLPVSNLEQEYYYQKNAFFQVIEQANNIKKYEVHITNFQRLLSNYFSQFISKFVKEKIYANSSNSSSPKKKLDFTEKNKASLNSKEIMNILNKVETEKFILENKSADVFCQINKLQQILLKNHEKLAKSFKDLLYDFFQDSKNEVPVDKENSKENSSLKSHSIKKSKTNASIPSDSSKKSGDNFSTKYQTKTQNDDNLSQFSPIEDLKAEFNDKIKEISNFGTNINLNMEKEKIFEKNPDFEVEEENKIIDLNNSFSNKINSEKPKVEQELEWRKKKSDEEEMAWRRKKPEDDDNWREHKDKINQLIERDKNKKSGNANQTFFKSKKSNYKKRNNMNKSFQKYNPTKFNFSKKIEYKQYNQFMQKNCSKCGSSFVTTKDDDICQNCKYISEDDERLMKRGRDFSNKKKFGFFQKNFGPKKQHLQPRFGNKKFFGKKNDATFTRKFGNKSLIHSSSNFLTHHKLNSPKGFNMNGKYKMNKGKENFDDNRRKNNFGGKKYPEKKKSEDDFEVDLESDKENTSDKENENDNCLSKTACEFNKNISDKKINKNNESNSDSDQENDSDDSKSDNSSDKKEPSEKENRIGIINDDSGENRDSDEDENENNDLECDF